MFVPTDGAGLHATYLARVAWTHLAVFTESVGMMGYVSVTEDGLESIVLSNAMAQQTIQGISLAVCMAAAPVGLWIQ